MKKLVVGSSAHKASINILNALGDVEKTLVCESSIVDLFELKDVKNTLLIVASPHSSSAGVMSLSVHTPGNFGDNEFGGNPKSLSIAPGLYLGNGLRKFQEIKEREKLTHEVTLEVTHHGPSFNTPMIYVELGSDEKGWESKDGAKAAAEVIEFLLDLEPSGDTAIGVGGPHYAPNFTKWTLGGRNFGHICPKYGVEDLTEKTFEEMILKTIPKPEVLVIDWKGTPSSYRKNIEKMANSFGLTIERAR
ncbi:MAG: hypothetical protein GOV01_01535 [Candidatus Altiarchaeota archaeon]|nr:hypothetical protein [Candidatus Altiarchaeota archaeon]